MKTGLALRRQRDITRHNKICLPSCVRNTRASVLGAFQRTCSICLLALVPFLRLQAQSTPAPRVPAGRQAVADTAALRAFFGEFFDKHVSTSDYPSAAAIVVKDGRVVFEKGYGYTNFEKTKLVTADKTVFFAASVSKLFVATAVMQLAEQGKVKLDANVDDYLRGFQLGNKYGKPVTLADLLTHTSGLDDHMLGAEIPITNPPVALGEYFSRNPPPRVRPPGQQINYSNHGMALAGYVVEAVSGVPFYEYVEKNIFAPLGMTHSTFRQPVPAPLRADIGLERFSKPRTLPYPVATLVSTVDDMGKFMLAHLETDTPGAPTILRSSTLADMHRQHFTAHPDMPGVAYGFFKIFDGGQRGLYHTGGRDHFSLLYLLPKEHLGVYLVMAGTEDESVLLPNMLGEFLKRFYGGREFQDSANHSSAQGSSTSRFAGTYRVNLVSRATVEKVGGMALEATVSKDDSSRLTLVIPGRAPHVLVLADSSPPLFRTDDGAYVTFLQREGVVTNMVVGGMLAGHLLDPTTFERIPWYLNGRLHLALLVGAFGLFVLFLAFAGATALRTRLRRPAAEPRTEQATRAKLAWRWAVCFTSCALLSPVSGLVMILLTKDHQLYSIPPILRVALGFLLLAAISGLALPAFALVAWRQRFWSVPRRLLFTVLAVAAAGMIPFMDYWNLLGYRF